MVELDSQFRELAKLQGPGTPRSGWVEYVGWRDMESALRYLDAPTAGLQERFESGLGRRPDNS